MMYWIFDFLVSLPLPFMTDGSFREDCHNLTSLLVQPISVKLAKELLSAQSIRYSQPCVPMEMASSSGKHTVYHIS